MALENANDGIRSREARVISAFCGDTVRCYVETPWEQEAIEVLVKSSPKLSGLPVAIASS